MKNALLLIILALTLTSCLNDTRNNDEEKRGSQAYLYYTKDSLTYYIRNTNPTIVPEVLATFRKIHPELKVIGLSLHTAGGHGQPMGYFILCERVK